MAALVAEVGLKVAAATAFTASTAATAAQEEERQQHLVVIGVVYVRQNEKGCGQE